ncbi:MAG: hypothetical protein HWN68_07735 [Desulfobacterales bacterium]|nr:hypothetical protein [Desulfobacterales bacterium]
MKKWIYAIFGFMCILLATGIVEGYLVDYGLVNPVVGGMTLPFFTAAILVVFLYLLKKYAKVEVW